MSRAPDPPPFDADRLIAEGRSLRSLARSLLGDDRADDIVHDSYLAALRQRGAVERPGAWLSGVVTRLATRWRRTETRRIAREQRVVRDEIDAAADPARIAAAAETLRAIATAVHELDEPFRTVIVLRFWHDVTTHDIAARLHVPHDTVRSRLFRGIERLRASLDARHGGRDAWRGAVVALVAPREAAAAPALSFVALAGILMNAKLLIGGVLAAALVFVLAQTWPPTVPADQQPNERTVAAAPVVATKDAAELERAPTREVVAASQPPLRPGVLATTDDHVAPWRLQVIVQDTDKKPVADATVRVWLGVRVLHRGQNAYSGRQDAQLTELRTDALGRAETTVDREGVMVRAEHGRAMTAGYFAWARHADVATVLTLPEPIPLRGRVVRPDRSPVPDAVVTAIGRKHPDSRTLGYTPDAAAVRTGDDGAFELLLVPDCCYSVQGTAAEGTTLPVEVYTLAGSPPDVELTFPGAMRVLGIVVDPDGTPVPNASVRVWRENWRKDRRDAGDRGEQLWLHTDAAGRFATDVRQNARYGVLAAMDAHAPSDVVHVEPTPERPQAEARVVLQRFASIRGRVMTVNGTPLANALVHASSGPIDMAAFPEPDRRERFTTGGEVTTGDDGGFELRVHPGITWSIVVTPNRDVRTHRLHRDGIAPGTDGLVIAATPDELLGCTVTGTAVAPDGELGPRASFHVGYVDEAVIAAGTAPIDATWDASRFRLPTLEVGRRITIRVEPEPKSGFAPQRFGPLQTTSAGLQLDVRWQPFAELPVRIVMPDGRAAELSVNLAPREPAGSGAHGPTAVGADGCVTLRLRQPGPNTLYVFDVNRRRELLREDVVLVPGPNAELVVTLPATGTDKR